MMNSRNAATDAPAITYLRMLLTLHPSNDISCTFSSPPFLSHSCCLAPSSLPEQFSPLAKKAHHSAPRKNPLQSTIGNNWQLIDVLPTHGFEGLKRGRVGGYRLQLTQRPHHALHTGLRPAVPWYSAHLIAGDKSSQGAVLHNHKAPPSASQQVLVNEIL